MYLCSRPLFLSVAAQLPGDRCLNELFVLTLGLICSDNCSSSHRLTSCLYNLCFPPLLWLDACHQLPAAWGHMKTRSRQEGSRERLWHLCANTPCSLMEIYLLFSYPALLVREMRQEKLPQIPKRPDLKITVVLWLNPGIFINCHSLAYVNMGVFVVVDTSCRNETSGLTHCYT